MRSDTSHSIPGIIILTARALAQREPEAGANSDDVWRKRTGVELAMQHTHCHTGMLW